MREFTIVILILASLALGALAHEWDMHMNCQKSGNAKAFTVEIKCSEMKQK